MGGTLGVTTTTTKTERKMKTTVKGTVERMEQMVFSGRKTDGWHTTPPVVKVALVHGRWRGG